MTGGVPVSDMSMSNVSNVKVVRFGHEIALEKQCH